MKKLDNNLEQFNLIRIDQRREYLKTLSLNVSDQLTKLGILNTRVRIDDSSIDIGLQKQNDEAFYSTEFGTNITFYHKDNCPMRGDVKSKINYDTNGIYGIENVKGVWKARAVVSILDNWQAVEAIAIQATQLRNVLLTIKVSHERCFR